MPNSIEARTRVKNWALVNGLPEQIGENIDTFQIITVWRSEGISGRGRTPPYTRQMI